MFGSMTFDHVGADTYAEARRYYDTAKPWRGETDEGDERPLKGRRYRNTGVRLKADDSVAFRLHRTDVVTYHPDGKITLNCYSSVTTSAFMSAHTPSGIYPSLTGHHVSVRGKYYRAGHMDRVVVNPDGTAAATNLWRRYDVDRKASNALRKEWNLTKAYAVIRAAKVLGVESTWPPVRSWDEVDLRAILKDRSRWSELTREGMHAKLDKFSEMLIRDSGGLVAREPRYHLDSHKEVMSYRRACAKWGTPY